MKLYTLHKHPRTPKCSNCMRPAASAYCSSCLARWPMLKRLVPTPVRA
ncbi:MAG TPA: hypothetical protein VK629_04380 [Steroidobacteraceae bacterium]|nr:hypothetical protein [Steroidobacteraceae bacterium]